jgi:glucosylceramidase
MISKYFFWLVVLVLTGLLIHSCAKKGNAWDMDKNGPVAFVTTADASKKFEQEETLFRDFNPNQTLVIDVDPSISYQKMDGFGYTLTGGSAQLLWKMSPDKRAKILTELFSRNENSIGVSYLRVSLGSSDLDEKVFSYNDIPTGSKDFELEHFTLKEDRNDLIPVLKEILKINPDIPIMASPWSAPLWMKTNNSSIGGSLKSDCFDVYSDYFVKYINEMASEGIRIDAITVQNEPLHPGNNPSMLMPWEDQLRFIRDYIGPKFEKEEIDTKIILYDHNADHIEYPINIMNDPLTKQYVDGSAFHLYGGGPSEIGKVHEAHPDRNLYFTEQWIGAPGNFAMDVKWHIQNVFIGGSRNWCKVILEWNLAADPNQDPHSEGGCNSCLGALTIDGDIVERNTSYYIVAHASKHVLPGSYRIESTLVDGLPNVAFLTPDNNIVVLVVNDKEYDLSFNIKQSNSSFSTKLPAGAVATYVWKNKQENEQTIL